MYNVEDVSPVSEYDVSVVVATGFEFLYILYPATAMLSVEAVHARFICVDEAGVALSPIGWDGGVVSGVDIVK